MSEIDKLFSKLAPEPSRSPAPIPAKSEQQGITLDGLFAAALSGQNPTDSASTSTNRLQPHQVSNPNTTSRSLALLDSIFASATPDYPNGSADSAAQTSAPALPIISPQPTVSPVPQVLNQDVISTLLGLAPSPGGSVSSSSTNITTYRYEGDNESNSEGGTEEVEYPTSDVNSILAEATRDAITSSKGKQSSLPSFSFPAGPDDVQTTPRIQGDVTPRPSLKGIPTSSPSQQPKDRNIKVGATRKSQNGITPADVPQVPSTKADKTKPTPGTSRKLVPFEPDSELWPYPRQPLDDRTLDDDVVELDFNETSALSDINTFLSKSKAHANATNGAGASGKKKKKERNKEEREQIEKSWDDPVKMGYAVGPNIPNEPPTKPVQPQPAAVSSVKGKNKSAVQPQTNGKVNGQFSASSSGDKDKAKDGLDRDAVTESLISTVAKSSLPKQKDVKQMDRNTFVREVLTLFHVSDLALTIRSS